MTKSTKKTLRKFRRVLRSEEQDGDSCDQQGNNAQHGEQTAAAATAAITARGTPVPAAAHGRSGTHTGAAAHRGPMPTSVMTAGTTGTAVAAAGTAMMSARTWHKHNLLS